MDSNSNHDDYKKFIVLNLKKELSKEDKILLFLLTEACEEKKKQNEYQVEFSDGKYRVIPRRLIS